MARNVSHLMLNHRSFQDFLNDAERSKEYHVDYEEWMYTAFCDALSAGCKILRFSMDPGVKSPLQRLKGLSVTAP